MNLANGGVDLALPGVAPATQKLWRRRAPHRLGPSGVREVRRSRRRGTFLRDRRALTGRPVSRTGARCVGPQAGGSPPSPSGALPRPISLTRDRLRVHAAVQDSSSFSRALRRTSREQARRIAGTFPWTRASSGTLVIGICHGQGCSRRQLIGARPFAWRCAWHSLSSSAARSRSARTLDIRHGASLP